MAILLLFQLHLQIRQRGKKYTTHVFSNELRVFKENELLVYFLINYACRDSKQTTSLFFRIRTEMQSRISYTKETIEKNISEGSFSLRKKDDLPAQEGF